MLEKIVLYLIVIWAGFLLTTMDEYSLANLGRLLRDIVVIGIGYYIFMKIYSLIEDHFEKKKWKKFYEEYSKEVEEDQQRWKDLEACDFDQEKYDQLIRDRNAKK